MRNPAYGCFPAANTNNKNAGADSYESAPAFLERLMGVEPTSSAWKADVLAVVRQPHNSVYYTCPQGDLSSPQGGVFWSLLQFCHFILHFAPLTILAVGRIINTESVSSEFGKERGAAYARHRRYSPRQKSAGPPGGGYHPPDHQPREGGHVLQRTVSCARGPGAGFVRGQWPAGHRGAVPRCKKLPLR